jgi:hypothetical protein
MMRRAGWKGDRAAWHGGRQVGCLRGRMECGAGIVRYQGVDRGVLEEAVKNF